jgi:hypothetical protein
LEKAWWITDMVYGEEEAVKWADGFTFDQGMLDDVEEEFIGFGCSFKELVRSRGDRIASVGEKDAFTRQPRAAVVGQFGREGNASVFEP